MKVRFTGKRLGWAEADIPGFGTVKVGDVIDVSDEAGEEMTREWDGKADWEAVKAAKAEKAEEETDGR